MSKLEKESINLEGTNFVDSLGKQQLSMEEQIEMIRREVAEQAEAALAEEKFVQKKDEDITEDEALKAEIETSEDFVDEGKNILWPGGRRVGQLFVLTMASQVLFFFWVNAMNAIIQKIPNIAEATAEIVRGLIKA
eukprot:CAMPEP_0171457644 /NCGR_PEP_ID=MMETSP0945-20130129/3640_1 /TAXON_ID=109269 /ORGANISM="Vaucheria litorea, Strain CCMP2940" /LENGTH=135 /DNA_ID=CAMNT_0011983293 /DNA_START=165 /DNA_END=572 /DNA_ORIENTATION=-